MLDHLKVKVLQLCSKHRGSTVRELDGRGKCNCDEFVEKASPFEPFLDTVNTIPPTILLGFSKGGVVLNQVLAEIADLEELQIVHDGFRDGNFEDTIGNPDKVDGEGRLVSTPSVQLKPSEAEDFLRSIEEVHYVDVGLNCQGAYQTDPKVLEILPKAVGAREQQCFYVGIHGTPRQWQDRHRRWVVLEKNRCVALLTEAARKYANGKLHMIERLYFGEGPPDLQMHFEIIDSLILR